MKVLKKTSIFLLVLIIIAAILPSSAFAAADEEKYFGKSILNWKNNRTELIWAYEKIAFGIENAETDINIEHNSYKINSEDLKLVIDMILYDHPEFFWLDFNGDSLYSWSHYPDGTVADVHLFYSLSGNSLSSAKTEFNNKISALTSDLSGKSDYEKSLILHDRVAEAVTYAFKGQHQTAYGALIKGQAVCAGYARAYQLLLHKVGIPAWYVTGTGINPDTKTSEGHAWNMVKLDGAWYYSDVTWDDQGENLYHAYLNLTTAYINEDHTPSDEIKSYLPMANSSTNNYFKKNNAVYSSFDFNRIKAAFSGNKTINVFVTGNINSFIEAFRNRSQDLALALSAGPISGYSRKDAHIGREIKMSITLIDINHQHSLKHIPKKNPTCASTGYNEYYACECGKLFSDRAGTNEMTDTGSLKLTALTHSPSGWKNDAVNHWKKCANTSCGSLIVNTKAKHTDKNSDNKCDICSYILNSPPPPPNGEPIENSSDDEIETPNTLVSDNSPSDTEETPDDTVSEPAEAKPFTLLGLSKTQLTITAIAVFIILSGGITAAVIVLKKKPKNVVSENEITKTEKTEE